MAWTAEILDIKPGLMNLTFVISVTDGVAIFKYEIPVREDFKLADLESIIKDTLVDNKKALDRAKAVKNLIGQKVIL